MAEPYEDYDRYADDLDRWEKRRPVCAYCNRHIVANLCYEFDNGDIVCPDCLEDYLKAHENLMLDLAIERAEEYYEILTENREETE